MNRYKFLFVFLFFGFLFFFSSVTEASAQCSSYTTSSSCNSSCSPTKADGKKYECKWLSASQKCSEGALECTPPVVNPPGTCTALDGKKYSSGQGVCTTINGLRNGNYCTCMGSNVQLPGGDTGYWQCAINTSQCSVQTNDPRVTLQGASTNCSEDIDTSTGCVKTGINTAHFYCPNQTQQESLLGCSLNRSSSRCLSSSLCGTQQIDFTGTSGKSCFYSIYNSCNGGIISSPTPTPTVTPTRPPVLIPTDLKTAFVCASPYPTSNTGSVNVTFAWIPPTGATKSRVDIDNQINPWSGSCTNPNLGDSCNTTTLNKLTKTLTLGRTYLWKVTSYNSANVVIGETKWLPLNVDYRSCYATPTPSPTSTPSSCTPVCTVTGTQCVSSASVCTTAGGTPGLACPYGNTSGVKCEYKSCIDVCQPTPQSTSLSTSTPAPTPSAMCQNITPYSTLNWSPLFATDFNNYKAGDSVYFCVAGTTVNTSVGFEKAQFTINDVVQPETVLKRPNSNDFCQLYTIPNGTYNFVITAQLYHSLLGWR